MWPDALRAEPRDGPKQAIGGGIEDGERRAGPIAPHRQGVLDEGVRVGGQEWLGIVTHRAISGSWQTASTAGASAGRHGRRTSSSMVRIVPGSPSTGPSGSPAREPRPGRHGQPARRSASQRILTTSWNTAPPSWSLNGYSTISFGTAVSIERGVDGRRRTDLVHQPDREQRRCRRAPAQDRPVEVGEGREHLVDLVAMGLEVQADLAYGSVSLSVIARGKSHRNGTSGIARPGRRPGRPPRSSSRRPGCRRSPPPDSRRPPDGSEPPRPRGRHRS